MPAVLTTTDLRRDYGGRGLLGVDVAVEEGSVYGLVGPNGAGKTTLLSIVTGLRRADSGRVRIAVDRRQVAVCNDVPDFEPWLTAREVVSLAATLVTEPSRTDGGSAAGRVDEVLGELGLREHADTKVGSFSRGMRQRLGLAAALVGDPALLVLDEPTSALDPVGRREILDLVGTMGGRRTVVFSSHVLADVQRVCDSVGVLSQGRLVWQGPMRELLDQSLRPSWRIRVRGGADALVATLRARAWVERSDASGSDEVWVQGTSLAAGEAGLGPALAESGVALVSVDPVGADLESAFLALTEEEQ